MGTLLAWSSGKDSALSLHALREAGTEPVGLLTTFSEPDETVSHHGVPRELVLAQADAVGLELHEVHLPDPCPNEVYERRMALALASPALAGVDEVAFGDLHLADVRDYRERRMREAGLRARFPLWGADTARLARRFVDDGFRAVVCVVDTEQLDAAFVGRELDGAFLDDLPDGTDPCGEHGEYHSFVTDGPDFGAPVEVGADADGGPGRFARVALVRAAGG